MTAGSRPRNGKRRRIRRRQTSMAINVTSFLLIVGIIGVVAFAWMRGGITGGCSGEGNGVVVVVEVAQGPSLSERPARLVEEDVGASEEAFMGAANSHTRAGELQPGFYRLEQRMSAESA